MAERLSYLFDAFLTHDWGIQQDNHTRVAFIFRALKALGFVLWFDEVEMTGDIDSAMRKGIDDSFSMIFFITKRYIDKVNSESLKDNCFKEFRNAFTKNKPFILVVMDENVKPTDLNQGYAGMFVSNTLYINMSKEYKIDELVAKMAKLGIYPRAPPALALKVYTMYIYIRIVSCGFIYIIYIYILLLFMPFTLRTI